MKKAEKQELDQLFQGILHLFGGTCWICQQPFTTKKAFTIHHRIYKCFECNMTFPDIKKMLKHRVIHPNTDKVYTDFKIGKKVDKIAYYRYLMPLVIQEPERFLLLHHIHHWMAENLARPKPVFFSRLVQVAKEINERRYGVLVN